MVLIQESGVELKENRVIKFLSIIIVIGILTTGICIILLQILVTIF